MLDLEGITTEFFTLFSYIRDQYLRPAEQITRSRLSPAQFHAIAVLHRQGPLSMTELAAELKISKQQLTPLIDRLIANGLAVRKKHPGDRRIVQIEITPEGRQTFETLWRDIRNNFKDRLSLLPEMELMELEAMMLRMKAILAQNS